MKIVIGGFHQETNAFSSVVCDKSFFRITPSDEVIEANRGKNSNLGGIIAAVEAAGATMITAPAYYVGAGGRVADEVIEDLLKDLITVIDANLPIDGIFLELHGAAATVSRDNACGYILETLRNHVGKDVVIVSTSDLHGNIVDKVTENIDAISGYQTYPHVDQYNTGFRAATHGLNLLAGKTFYKAKVRIPMIVPAEGYNTNEGPFADLVNDAHALVNSGKILDFSIYQMQPWLDVEEGGSTVLVTAEDKDTAASCAKELAHRLFDLRKEMSIHLYSIDEVIDAALANETDMPVILVDSADSPNAGSSADSSAVLSRLLERGETIKTCMGIADAPAAAKAFEVGVGNEAEFSLGGTCEPRFQKATKVHAYVKALYDGTFQAETSQGMAYSTGKTAILQVGNIDIVVYSRLELSSDPQCYRAFGIEPAHYRLVTVKSATQYKVTYSKFSNLFYPTDTPGSSSANLLALPFERLPRPFYPFDDIETFDDTVIFY